MSRADRAGGWLVSAGKMGPPLRRMSAARSRDPFDADRASLDFSQVNPIATSVEMFSSSDDVIVARADGAATRLRGLHAQVRRTSPNVRVAAVSPRQCRSATLLVFVDTSTRRARYIWRSFCDLLTTTGAETEQIENSKIAIK